MTTQVLGPRGSRRRRFTIVPILVAALAALLVTAGGQAALPSGVFELDKNAANNGAGSQPARSDDWNDVYAAIQANDGKCASLGAAACAFAADGVGTSIFTGGGSKDPLDIPNWQHTAGSVPDKDEILNAYAAKYVVGGEQILYFGADRFAQNGSADFGFWFFKDKVAPITSGADAGKFTGVHTVGDILILGTFTQGGAVATARIYKWVGSGGSDGPIDGPVANFGDCVPGSAGQNGCITVNSSLAPVAWPYQAKTGGTPANNIPDGGFVEGGINLSAIGLSGCFSSFIAETRSSPSLTATLKDFAGGSFEVCETSLVTTPKDGSSNNLGADSNSNNLVEASIGTGSVSVRDSAALTVNGVASFAGTLKFFICGPISSGACSSGGVPAGETNVTGNGTYASGAVTLTSAGRYCWRAEFSSTTQGVPPASDARTESAGTTGECFEVLPVRPTLRTSAVASPIDFGQPAEDRATLGLPPNTSTSTQPGSNGGFNGAYTSINATNGAAAGGVIKFTLYKNDCTTPAVAKSGTTPTTQPQEVSVSGNGTYPPANSAAIGFTPDEPGTYHWRAEYVPVQGDPNNLGSVHNADCQDTSERVVVNQVPTSITTRQFVYPQDKAVITVSTGTLAGSVAFKLYDTAANCAADGTAGLLYGPDTVTISGASPQPATTNNTSFRLVTGTTVYWRVTYVSTNDAHIGSSSVCTEQTTVSYAGNDSSIIVP